jgi:hypothetical protein
MDTNDSNEVHAFHKTHWHVVPRFKLSPLSPPAARINTVTDSGDLLALLSFNVACARRRLDLAACCLILAHTGCRPAEIVDGEKAIPSDGCWEELFGAPSSSALPQRPRPSATRTCSRWWCATRRQGGIRWRCQSTSHTTRAPIQADHLLFHAHQAARLLPVTHIVSLAVLNGAFASPTLNDSVDTVSGARVSGPVSHTPLRW